MVVALVATVAVQAQKISAVSKEGKTILYHTLQEAIEGASPGSVIYLAGGAYPISDDVFITKKLTIIGIGYKVDGENADGNTVIAGSVHFCENSDGSAVVGCHLTGNVNIGENSNDKGVNDIWITQCNLNSVQIHYRCTGVVLNQNYIRSESNFGGAEVTINNNIISKISNVGSGVISNNVCCHNCTGAARYNQYYRALENVNNATVIGNIFRGETMYFASGSACIISGNLFVGGSVGENPVVISAGAGDIFTNVNGWSITPYSNFHFKDPYIDYEGQVGIYAGKSFDDKALPPTPFIVEKSIPEKTNASGKLNIKIRVKANE